MRAQAQEIEVAQLEDQRATSGCAGVCQIAATLAMKPTEAAWTDRSVKARLRVLRSGETRHGEQGRRVR